MSLEERPLWLSFLKAKYFPSSSPMLASSSGGSQFWRQLVKVRPIFQSLVKFVVRNGKSTRFWLDWWCGASPLEVSFPILFSFVSSPSASITELTGKGWDLSFHRVMSPVELEEWHCLATLFPMLSEAQDEVSWPHSAFRWFCVKSCYRVLSSGPKLSKFKPIWCATVPPKIKIFMWQTFHGNLPAADQIRKRNDPGYDRRVLCGAIENTEHIFFPCSLAKFVW